MKKPLLLLFVLMGILMFSCGPSEAEIKQKQAEKEKAIADSVALVVEEKRLQAEREKEIADSVAQVYEAKLKEKENSPAELRRNLITVERGNPLKYLEVGFKLDYKIIGKKDVVKGKITNNATLARYKDIKVEIYCYSGTKTLIKTIRKTIYEYVRPRSKRAFEHKFKSPSGTKTISVAIVGAKAG